jgi:alpha-tubulin suppressor-like RCC1 family protein
MVSNSLATGETVVGVFQNPTSTIVQTSFGAYYIYGDQSAQQAGIGVPTTSASTLPFAVEVYVPTKKIAFISSSQSHSLIITDGCDYSDSVANNTIAISSTGSSCIKSSKLYSVGNNAAYQLGDGTNTTKYSLVALNDTLLSGLMVADFASGQNINVLLTTTGKLYLWGSNTDSKLTTKKLTIIGLLGDGSATTSYKQYPTLLSATAFNNRTVLAITIGATDILTLTSDNNIVGWGSNAYGQLGGKL